MIVKFTSFNAQTRDENPCYINPAEIACWHTYIGPRDKTLVSIILKCSIVVAVTEDFDVVTQTILGALKAEVFELPKRSPIVLKN